MGVGHHNSVIPSPRVRVNMGFGASFMSSDNRPTTPLSNFWIREGFRRIGKKMVCSLTWPGTMRWSHDNHTICDEMRQGPVRWEIVRWSIGLPVEHTKQFSFETSKQHLVVRCSQPNASPANPNDTRNRPRWIGETRRIVVHR